MKFIRKILVCTKGTIKFVQKVQTIYVSESTYREYIQKLSITYLSKIFKRKLFDESYLKNFLNLSYKKKRINIFFSG